MAQNDGDQSTFGARLAERIGSVLADRLVDTRLRLAPVMKDIGMQVFTDATNHMSDEFRGVFGPIWRQVAERPETPDAIRPVLHNLGNARGQAFALLAGSTMGAAMGGGFLDLITNYLAPPIGYLIAQHPNMGLGPEQAAQLESRNIFGLLDNQYEAARRGIDEDRFKALVQLAYHVPTSQEALMLYNRGVLDYSGVTTMLARSGLHPDYIGETLSLARQRLTPEQVAAGWARNLVTIEQAQETSRTWGVHNDDTDVLLGLAGEPPPLDALITAWRRGIITEADVDRGIVQGPIRNEWIPTVKALQWQPLPVEQAAVGVTQGHMTVQQGEEKAALSGVRPEDFAVIVDNSGLPPGIEWAAEAFNRGIITDDEYVQMFLESRIKNKYIGFMKEMRQRLIPAETVRLMYRMRVYPYDAAVQTLKGHGFTETDAKAQLALEDARATEKTRDLTQAQALALYEDDIIPRDQAGHILTDLGYDQRETEWLLSIADTNKVRRYVNALITKVHNGVLSGNISTEDPNTSPDKNPATKLHVDAQGRPYAVELLDEAGLSPAARDRYMTLWALETQALTATLTPSQITAAFKRGILSREDANARLVARGYSDIDADILLQLATPAGG